MAREAGDYTVATSMVPPGPCEVHELVVLQNCYEAATHVAARNPKSIKSIMDPLQRGVVEYCAFLCVSVLCDFYLLLRYQVYIQRVELSSMSHPWIHTFLPRPTTVHTEQ